MDAVKIRRTHELHAQTSMRAETQSEEVEVDKADARLDALWVSISADGSWQTVYQRAREAAGICCGISTEIAILMDIPTLLNDMIVDRSRSPLCQAR